MTDVKCGESECETEGAENRACFPISVGSYDPDFNGKQCLMFVRTQEVLRDDCSLSTDKFIAYLSKMLRTVHCLAVMKD